MYTLYQTLQPSKSVKQWYFIVSYPKGFQDFNLSMPCFVDEVLLPFSDLAGPLSPLHPTCFLFASMG